jgi:Zinc dependent phospholipase C
MASAYSLLTHEQVVDIAWKDQIVPLLVGRFPDASQQDLHQAHAYGGCLVQDLGYYPFGSRFFSDLTHYVRTGDFVENLIHESTNLNEYAFGLGALAHYSSDNVGHPIINHAVALSFPCLRARYGEEVTYAEDPKAHLRTEFGFDLVQIAKGRYTSQSYHDFIGFEIAKPLLERAFFKTSPLPLRIRKGMGHGIPPAQHGSAVPDVSPALVTQNRAAQDAGLQDPHARNGGPLLSECEQNGEEVQGPAA